VDAPHEPPVPVPQRLGLRVALASALGLVVATGVLLLFAYDRHDAHASIAALAPWLQAVRSLHHASTSLLVLLLLWRLVEVLRARESRWTWWATGAALFAALAAFEMGIVLRGDQWGYEALLHDRSVPGAAFLTVPLAFWAHLGAATAVVAALLLAARPWAPDGCPTVRDRMRALRADARAWLAPLGLVLLAVGALALLVPARLGPAPFAALEVMRPAWPFLWLDPLEDRWGLVVLLEAPVLAALVLALYPFAAPPRRPEVPFVVLLTLVALLGFVGAFTPVGGGGP